MPVTSECKWQGYALRLLCRAIQIDPNSVYGWNGLGNLLQDHLGRFEEAEQAYRHVLRTDPNAPYAWYNLGLLLTPIFRMVEPVFAPEGQSRTDDRE